jgi:DNA-binding NtrC family response regulator
MDTMMSTMDKPMLLIVDDESQIRELLFHIFENRYRLRSARNGLEAIKSLQENGTDLVILDIVMPVMNGIEVLLWMKENGINIPIVLMSSFDVQMQPPPFGDLGKNRFISKPFDIDELRQLVMDVIQSQEPGLYVPFFNRRLAERRSLEERRQRERRSQAQVDASVLFRGVALRREGKVRRKEQRRIGQDRRELL